MGSDLPACGMTRPIRVLDDLRDKRAWLKASAGTDLGLWLLLTAPMGGDAPPGAVYRFCAAHLKEEHVLATWLNAAVSFRQDVQGYAKLYPRLDLMVCLVYARLPVAHLRRDSTTFWASTKSESPARRSNRVGKTRMTVERDISGQPA